MKVVKYARHTLLAGLSASLAAPAAVSASPLPFSCAAVNAENIASGHANAQGYTASLVNAQGVWTIPLGVVTVPLPPNGVICVKSIVGPTGFSGTERVVFERNSANTPAYVLAEDGITLNFGTLDVSGVEAVSANVVFGASRLGGRGGPGGSDGGSADIVFGPGNRMSSGSGPGGGRARTSAGGGGGASPLLDGAPGFNGATGDGGVATGVADTYQLHGGSGGGAGIGSSTAGGGGGGGGVLIVATNGALSMSSASGGLRARGGAVGLGAQGGGGGGGGGTIRVIADKVEGSGTVDVRGGGRFSGSCGTSSYAGGCGGNGVIRFETPAPAGVYQVNVSSGVLQSATTTNGGPSVRFGPIRDFLPAPALRARVEIVSIQTDLGQGMTTQTNAPALAGPLHAHQRPTLTTSATSTNVVVTVRTVNVPETAAVTVRRHAVAAGDGNFVDVLATDPTGTGAERLWTATLALNTDALLGTFEAWVDTFCTPGTPGCPALE